VAREPAVDAWSRPQSGWRAQPYLNKNPNSNGSKQIQTIPIFGRSEKYVPLLGKIEMKYDFEDLEEINNFLHRNFSRLGMNLKLKLREFSRLEIDRISS
jgi:hypothetical protein